MSSSLSDRLIGCLVGVRKRKRAQREFASSVLVAKMELVPTSDGKKKRSQKKDRVEKD